MLLLIKLVVTFVNWSSLDSSSGSPQLEGVEDWGISKDKMAFDSFDYFCHISDKRENFVAL